jgi:hypothetical protein
MSKFFKKNENKEKKPLTDWDKDYWVAQDYRNHETDFIQMEKEMMPIREKVYSPIMWRWYWLQTKNACRLQWSKNKDGENIFEPMIKREYMKFSSMYDHFTEWRAFNEAKEEQLTGVMRPKLTDVIKQRGLPEAKIKLKECFGTPLDFGQHDELSEFVQEAVNGF